jgi:hypothetical protein
MRYIQPQITGIFAALATIHGTKHGISTELPPEHTIVAAYEADE